MLIIILKVAYYVLMFSAGIVIGGWIYRIRKARRAKPRFMCWTSRFNPKTQRFESVVKPLASTHR